MNTEPASENVSQNGSADPKRLRYVLLVVLILCGGNGISLVTAAILWKVYASFLISALAVIGITLIAFIGAMALIVSHNLKQKANSDLISLLNERK